MQGTYWIGVNDESTSDAGAVWLVTYSKSDQKYTFVGNIVFGGFYCVSQVVTGFWWLGYDNWRVTEFHWRPIHLGRYISLDCTPQKIGDSHFQALFLSTILSYQDLSQNYPPQIPDEFRSALKAFHAWSSTPCPGLTPTWGRHGISKVLTSKRPLFVSISNGLFNSCLIKLC